MIVDWRCFSTALRVDGCFAKFFAADGSVIIIAAGEDGAFFGWHRCVDGLSGSAIPLWRSGVDSIGSSNLE
jgi:hypothetical protein